jgi:hypothetical protein
MRHLDEHTLAFYAMGADFSSSEKEAIEAHVSECEGCRAQIEELRAIDQHVAETSDLSEQTEDLPSSALVTFRRAIRRRPGDSPIWSESRIFTRGRRFTVLVKRHPLVAGSGGLALAFLAFFLFRFLAGYGHAADQPQFIRMNATGTAMDVYGKDAKIFDIPVSAMAASEETRERFSKACTCIADIEGDGSMEVISGAAFLEEGKEIWNCLRIFSNDGRLVHKWMLGHSVLFAGSPYSNFFGIAGVATINGKESGQKEILVALLNDRSPYCLIRMDNKGRTKGEYWHFGWLNGPTVTHIAGNEGEVVLLAGINDVGYRSDKTFPVFTVLDPTRLDGNAESGQTKGFGFPTSNAELYYARVGIVNAALVSGVNVIRSGFSRTVKIAPDSSFTLSQTCSSPEGFPTISYTFDKNISLNDVWLSDSDRMILRAKFLTQKTSAALDAFRLDLSNKVEFWDGSQWNHQTTRVIRPLP